jgi:hypothetical protein
MIPAGCDSREAVLPVSGGKRRKGLDRLDGSISAVDEVNEQRLHVEDPYLVATGEIE